MTVVAIAVTGRRGRSRARTQRYKTSRSSFAPTAPFGLKAAFASAGLRGGPGGGRQAPNYLLLSAFTAYQICGVPMTPLFASQP